MWMHKILTALLASTPMLILGGCGCTATVFLGHALLESDR